MKDNKKLFLIDGMALIYRSYYAMIKNPLTSSSGLNTSAIYGFINSLIKLLKEQNPDYISVVLDTKAKTFRHLKYDLYKANRKPMPDDLSEQLPVLYDILKSLNIKVYKMDGFEADDIIGTITKESSEKNINTFMYSSDKDLMQLIDDYTFLYSPGNSFKPTKIYEKDDVHEKWGVYPKQFIDYLALLGDTSDNIPGVKGVGSKTAAKLIDDFKSIDGIYSSINKIENLRIKNILMENKKSACLSRELVTIDVNMNIEFDFDEMKTGNLIFENIIEKLHNLDIYTFDKALLDNNVSNEEQKKNIKKNYKTLIDHSQVSSFVSNIKNKKILSIDLETTGLDPNSAQIVGFSFSYKKNSGYYIPILCPDDSILLDLEKTLNILRPIFESDKIKFIGQNIKYDALILKRHDIELDNIVFDTMIAESLIAPEKNSYKLDYLSEEYLNYKMIPIENLIGDKKEQLSMKSVPLKDISFYACEDADIVFQIYQFQKKILIDKKLDKLFYEVEIPLLKVLINVEHNGVYVDKGVIENLCIDLKGQLKILSNKIYLLSGKEFNINSPKQLSEILFDHLELKMFKKRSTSVEVLKKLVDYHPIADIILEYRHLNKLVNTYLEKLPNFINSTTNRIHTSFNQAIASTGRLSSTKPNFQNIPIKTDVGKSIRKAFKPYKDNNLIISFDYSQIELRILAHYSDEKKLINAFNNNLDIHTRTAALIYGISNEDVDYSHRRVAKIINYSIAYGAGPFRISQELKISIKEASMIINNYFDRYQGIKQYIEDIVTFGTKNGYVATIHGRRRNTLNLRSTNRNIQEAEKRATINMPIQGTAAELIKIAMINIDNQLREKKLKTKMILQVHDELLFEVPIKEKNDIIKLVKNCMENAMQFKVPITVDYNCGDSWYEAH